MSSINRGTLPTNFIDSVSTGTRLPQPEPQYWFAKAALGARLSLAAVNAGAPTVQQFVSMAGGGAPVPPGLDALVRAADAYPGAVMAFDDFGKGKGDTIKMRRPVFTNGTYTEASRTLNTDAAISTTGQIIKDEEVPVVLKEFHGPHDGTSVKPYAIWDFDAKYRANKDQLAGLVSLHMQRDIVKLLDTVIRDKFRVNLSATTSVTYSDGVANVGSFTSGAGHVANLEMILNARKAIADREWAPFSNGRYICLVPTKFNVDMIGDPDYRALSAQHGAGKNPIFGYLASIQDVDIFEVSTLKQYAATDTTADGTAVPTSVTVQEAIMFGPGVVGMGTALAPEVRWADDTNYGTVAKCIWYALMAFETLDTRGVQRILFQ